MVEPAPSTDQCRAAHALSPTLSARSDLLPDLPTAVPSLPLVIGTLRHAGGTGCGRGELGDAKFRNKGPVTSPNSSPAGFMLGLGRECKAQQKRSRRDKQRPPGFVQCGKVLAGPTRFFLRYQAGIGPRFWRIRFSVVFSTKVTTSLHKVY